MGSSPLARGLQSHHAAEPQVYGIIPARAGFTVVPSAEEQRAQDHPRSRGVYATVPMKLVRAGGSSPLARGLRRDSGHDQHDRRIIPARAGFTGRFRCCRSRRPDHPRSRGVYRAISVLPKSAPGSSPLARGLLERVSTVESGSRIIPARAGFTRCTNSVRRCAWDHPRSRGVYREIARPRHRDVGSSPLARGLRLRRRRTELTPRIIPARAGFTQCAPIVP